MIRTERIMADRIETPKCVICGRPGTLLLLGRIEGKDVAICYGCAELLYLRLGELAPLLKGVKPQKRLAPKPGMTFEKFKELVVKAVEERGVAQLFEYCRRYGLSRRDARALADQLVKERGWVKEEVDNKLFVRKAPSQQASTQQSPTP